MDQQPKCETENARKHKQCPTKCRCRKGLFKWDSICLGIEANTSTILKLQICSAKEANGQVKKSTECKRIFASHTSNKGKIFMINKKLKTRVWSFVFTPGRTAHQQRPYGNQCEDSS